MNGTIVFAIVFFITVVTVLAFTHQHQTIEVHLATQNGAGPSLGTITFHDKPTGMLIEPDLSGLTPGKHKMSLHEYPSCAAGIKDNQPVAGLAAGNYFDPLTHKIGDKKGAHLPDLIVARDGIAAQNLFVPHVKLSMFHRRAILIKLDQDGHQEVACGVIH